MNPSYKILAGFALSLMAAGLILSMYVGPGSGATSASVNSNVTVNSFVSVGLTNNLSNGVLFSSVDPGSRDNNATYNFNGSVADANKQQTSYWIYPGLDSNTNTDLCIRDNESLATGNPETNDIGNTNYTYSNATTNTATSPANYGTNNMTATAQNSLGIRFATNKAPGSPMFLRFFLNVSGGQPAGIYSNAVIFQAVATGTSVTCGGT